MRFDPQRDIQEMLDSTDETDIEVIARMFVDRVPDIELRATLMAVSRAYVVDAIHRRRLGNPILHPKQSARSSKVAALRQWGQALRDLIHVGGTMYKMLGDCTREDLIFAAEERERQALANQIMAARYRELAARIMDAGVETVRQLPEDMLA